MSTKIDTGTLESLGLTKKPEQAPNNNRLGQDEFLKLMVTQLKNQDPMKPMQNGEFMGQMAQFSAVTGIKELQTSFSQFATAMQSSQALQASALVGRSVLVPGEAGVLAQGGSLSGAVDLPASTSGVSLSVYNQAGQVVRRLEMGPQPAGLASFTWDGKTDAGDTAPAGKYKVGASATMEGRTAAVDTLMAATVESVTLGRGAQGPTLNVTGLGPLDLSSVRQIM